MAQGAGLNHNLELTEVASRQPRVSKNAIYLFNGDLRVSFSVERFEDQTLGASSAKLDEFVGGLNLLGNLVCEA